MATRILAKFCGIGPRSPLWQVYKQEHPSTCTPLSFFHYWNYKETKQSFSSLVQTGSSSTPRYRYFSDENQKLLFPRWNEKDRKIVSFLQTCCRKPTCRYYSDKSEVKEGQEKLSLFKRFKKMYRDYWYVLVPVHLVTSAAWFGGFYYLAESGVNIVGILENWNVSETILRHLRDSSMGYVAVAYALYKIATPLRYTVTLGGTTLSINYLKKWGYIKPVPSKEKLKEKYLVQKENLMVTIRETKQTYKEQKDSIIDLVRETKQGIKEQKDKLKDNMSMKANKFVDDKVAKKE